jgi:hypothetical protein
MNELNQIITEATAAVAEGYFRLPIFDDDAVYRERVYCYELYHQMRLRWPGPDVTQYRLTGEVDKKGHVYLTDLGVKGQKPDLLVHRPGYNENHAIIEVKHSNAASDGLLKDLATLKLFLGPVSYDRAIYLIYGEGADDKMLARIREAALQVGDCEGIEIWFHTAPLQAATQVDQL